MNIDWWARFFANAHVLVGSELAFEEMDGGGGVFTKDYLDVLYYYSSFSYIFAYTYKSRSMIMNIDRSSK
jgi:hypothetical protein